MVRPAQLIAVVASVVTVLVSGCAAGSGGNAAPSGRASATLTAGQRAALAEAQRRSRDPRHAAEVKRYRQKYEQLVTDCMRQAGFRYVPPPPEPSRPSDGPPWDANRFGFGISTLIDAQAQLSAADAAPIAGVPPSERAAHNRAAAECMRKVQERLGPQPGTVAVDVDLTGITDEARRQANTDPRVVRLTNVWAACMRAAGITAAGRPELLAEIETKAKPFRDAYLAARAGREGEPTRLIDILDPQQRQDLSALQRFELRAAAADRRCDNGLKAAAYKVFQEKLNALTGIGAG
jgi:hypothetical protein